MSLVSRPLLGDTFRIWELHLGGEYAPKVLPMHARGDRWSENEFKMTFDPHLASVGSIYLLHTHS
jgi:hypothetical protein